MRKLLAAAAMLLVGFAALASPIEFGAAMNALAGKTWSGVNASGDKFWFWHEGDGSSGKFAAKIEPSDGGSKRYTGTWTISGDAVCWAWDGWETFCYTKFEQDGETIAMTRRDGVVHTGTVVPGNTEGL